MRQSNYSGFLFIPVCFLLLISLILVQGITSQIGLVKQQIEHRIGLANVQSQATSGLNVASMYMNQIPELDFSPLNDFFYERFEEGFQLSLSETTCYLFRDKEKIYSIAFYKDYRAVLSKPLKKQN